MNDESDTFQELNQSKMPMKRSKSLSNLEFHSPGILEKTLKHNQVFLSSRQIINKIQLSQNAKVMLALRILLISLFCIYIPIETIFNNKLESIEKQIVVDYLTDLISSSIRKEKWYSLLTIGIIDLIAGKESIIILITIIYIIFPFIALKLVLVINFIYYIIVILQCMYASRRPFWDETSNETIVNPLCMTSYANPSNHFFFISFVYLYFTVSLGLVYKKEKFTLIAKCIIFVAYFAIVGGVGFILLVNKVHFIYQLSFAWSISLITICGLADLDDYIHNFIFKSLKNIFKTRQYKMKILFYVFALMLFSLLIFFFVPEDDLNIIKDRLSMNQYCNKQSVDELGIKTTFINITYIFGTIGAFWGASFAVEKDCSKWWEGSFKFLLLKILIILCFGIGFNYLTIYTELLFYEFRFIVLCLTNFLHYYITMGLIPVLFDYFDLNDEDKKHRRLKEAKEIKESAFVDKIIFSNMRQHQQHRQNEKMPLVDEHGFIQGKINKTNTTLNSKNIDESQENNLGYFDINNTVTITDEEKSNVNINHEDEKDVKKIYKESPLIKGLEKHANDERFEFTVKDELTTDINQLYLHFITNKIDNNEDDNDNSPKSHH